MRGISIILGLILGLAFAGFGVYVAWETAVPTYHDWQLMQSWQVETAELLSVSGADNRTEASYRYYISDKLYQNDRVYVTRFNDNIGSYHEKLQTRLRQLQQTMQPVTIWYNPADPQEAVIDRDMRWGLFALMSGFCAVFFIVGLIVV